MVAAKAGAEMVAEAQEEERVEAKVGVGWVEERVVAMVAGVMVAAAVRREAGGKRAVCHSEGLEVGVAMARVAEVRAAVVMAVMLAAMTAAMVAGAMVAREATAAKVAAVVAALGSTQ